MSDYGDALPLSESSTDGGDGYGDALPVQSPNLPHGYTETIPTSPPMSPATTAASLSLSPTLSPRTSNVVSRASQRSLTLNSMLKRQASDSSPLIPMVHAANEKRRTRVPTVVSKGSAHINSLDLTSSPAPSPVAPSSPALTTLPVSPRASAALSSSNAPSAISVGPSGKRFSTKANRHFLSLNAEQLDAAQNLAKSLVMHPEQADATSQLESLGTLQEKLALLSTRLGPAGAADALGKVVLALSSSGGSAEEVKKKVEEVIAQELTGLYSAKSLAGQRDWNHEFQELLEMDDGMAKFALLRALYSDFCYAAQSYGTIVISERHLPVNMKTIRPCSIGGVAGGEKYMVQNILFKFAVDQQIPSGMWMYGGPKPWDEAAMKAASNELTGLVHCFKCEVKGLHLPLAALIDSKGYRLAAFAVLPIDRSTLVYGSDNGGQTVVNKSRQCAAKMERLGAALNLMEHSVHGTRICVASDVEVHNGRDGRFYVLDFSRVFPPEAPVISEDGTVDSIDARAIFHRLLRPELVKRSDVPLSSDAFSKFQQHDPKDRALNGQVRVATEMLYNEIIPQVGLYISELPSFDSLSLIGIIHRAGINIRHLGRLRQSLDVKATYARKIILSEMCSRCIKVLLRSAMREQMKEYHLPSAEPFTMVVLDVLNLCFGWSFESAMYWKNASGAIPNPPSVPQALSVVPIKIALVTKFPKALEADEMRENVDLRELVDIPYVLDLLQKMMNVTLSAAGVETLACAGKNFLGLSHNDILSMDAKVKYLPIIDYYTGIELSLAAVTKHGEENKRLVKLAEARFRSTLAALPDHAPTFFQWGKLLHVQGSRSGKIDVFASAVEKFRLAMEIDPLHVEFRTGCAAALEDFGKALVSKSLSERNKTFLRQAMDKFREAFKLTPGTTSRTIVEVVRGMLDRICNNRIGTSEDDPAFAGASSLLELILARGDNDVFRLYAQLQLEWAAVLSRAIRFQDAGKDSVRCLGAAQKILKYLSLGEALRDDDVLGASMYESPLDVLRMFSVSRFASQLTERVENACMKITHIRFEDATGLSEAVLEAFWSCCPNLIKVEFIMCNISEPVVRVMSQKLKDSLKIVSFSGCFDLQGTYIEEMSLALGHNLTVANFSMCLVTDEALKALGQNCVNLERLSVAKTIVTGEALVPVMKSCKNLQVLDVSCCGNIKDKFFTYAAQYCDNLHTLLASGCVNLTIKGVSQIAKLPVLCVLDVSFCDKLDDKAFSALMRADELSEVYMKGNASRLDEKNLRKLATSFAIFLEKTLSERVSMESAIGASPRMGDIMLYDLSLDSVMGSRERVLVKRSPRKRLSSRVSASSISPDLLAPPSTVSPSSPPVVPVGNGVASGTPEEESPMFSRSSTNPGVTRSGEHLERPSSLPRLSVLRGPLFSLARRGSTQGSPEKGKEESPK